MEDNGLVLVGFLYDVFHCVDNSLFCPFYIEVLQQCKVYSDTGRALRKFKAQPCTLILVVHMSCCTYIDFHREKNNNKNGKLRCR